MRVRLGVLREYFSFLLVEGRVDDAREQYPDIDEEVFDNLVANQPAGSNNKYLMWSAKQVDDGTMPEEVIMAIRLFHDNQHRLKQKDINQYKSVAELDTAVDEVLKSKTKSQEAKQAKADSQVIYNDDRWLVVRPYTTEASCKYGAGSKWCISATASRNYFTSYSTNNNKFYFVVDKKATGNTPESKFAIAIIAAGLAAAGKEIQVYNASDHLVPLSTVARHVGEKWPEIWKKIQEHVVTNPRTREVEDAEKAAEEHVKALLKGEKLSDTALKVVAKDAKLTVPVVSALLKRYEDYKGPSDPRTELMNSLSGRAGDMPPEAAMMVIRWISSTAPAEGAYWGGNYYLERMFQHANLTPEDFRQLAQTKDEEVLANIFTNPNAPKDLKAEINAQAMSFKKEQAQRKVYWDMMRTGDITIEQFRHAMLKHPHLATTILQQPGEVKLTEEMIRMLPIRDVYSLKKLLEFPNAPPDFVAEKLDSMVGKLKKYDLYQIFRSAPLPTEYVEKLWKDKGQDVRTALLQNPAIGATNASKFAKSKNSAYRFSVAHNTITPAEDLSALADDESTSTKAAVAANPKTPADTLLKLAKDEAVVVRAGIASNPKAPMELLNALKKDSDEFVRRASRKNIKARTTTEAFKHTMIGLIREALEDDEGKQVDIMTPDWMDIPENAVRVPEFVAIFLLQNHGHATREEVQDAFQEWRGRPGYQELHSAGSRSQRSDEPLRGTTPSGKGWWWSPPGISKGALFRLTPAGAAAAMEVLERLRKAPVAPKATVTQTTARKGRTYYTPEAISAIDVTGKEDGLIDRQEVIADRHGEPVLDDKGKYKPTPWDQRGKAGSTEVYTYIPIRVDGRYDYDHAERLGKTLPRASIPKNAAVEFVKRYDDPTEKDYRHTVRALVKYKDKYLLVPFPLWVQSGGAQPPAVHSTHKATEPRKSPPPRELTHPEEIGAPRAPRGPKVSYKIYGRHRGAPAHTRLKGQAYAAPGNTQFRPGDQASLTVGNDGKLKVKKLQGDHEQTWEPVEG